MTNEHPAIDRDPSLESVLYVPSGIDPSRSTPIDSLHHYKLNSPTQRHLLAEPLSDTFYKNAIASGAITPPIGEGASVRRSDYLAGLCVICFVVLGIGAFIIGLLWR